jgi:hypothetical protein
MRRERYEYIRHYDCLELHFVHWEDTHLDGVYDFRFGRNMGDRKLPP